MEQEIKKTQEQENEERFVASFAYAMEVYEKKHRESELVHGTLCRSAYDRLKDDRKWNAEWIAGQYCRIVAGVCDLPLAIRKFIVFLGKGAQEKFDEEINDNEKAEEKQEVKADDGKDLQV